MSKPSESQKRAKKPVVADLYRLGMAHWGSGALFAALRLGLFDALAEQPRTVDALAKKLKTSKAWSEKLVVACAALGLVRADGDAYVNAEVAAAFLVKGSPLYQGDLMTYFADKWDRFGEMDRVVATGEIGPRESAATAERSEPERLHSERAWVLAMHNIAVAGQADALANAVSLRGCHKLLDVSGGAGTYAVWFAKQNPALIAEVLDLPEVVAVADEIIARYDLGARVRTRAGDFINDSYGAENDAVLFSGVLHGFTEARIQRLLKKALQSLRPGGRVIVQEMTLDAVDGGGASAFPALFSLNMLSGATYATAQLAGWMEKSGFVEIEVHRLKNTFWFDHVITGRRPLGF
jgi:SAM-dependent methyltransferase